MLLIKEEVHMAPRFLADYPGSRLASLRYERLAILPLGSIEYHGPHGALGTDLFIAEELARRVGDALDALILPAVPFTHCPPPTRSYHGTFDIAEETAARYFHDVVAGCLRLGVRGVLILNAHDANTRPAQTAVDRLSESYHDQFVLFVNWWEAMPLPIIEPLGLFSQVGGHGHGAPLEISAAEAARPGTADLAAARDIDMVESPGAGIVRALHEGCLIPNWAGHHGLASEASLEKGQPILELAVERITALTSEWLAEVEPDRRSSIGT